MPKIMLLHHSKGFQLHDLPKQQDALTTYYDLLDCSTITCTSFSKFGVRYDVITDDEALLKPEAKIILSINAHEWIANSLIITRTNQLGESIGLTLDEIENLQGYFSNGIASLEKDPKTWWYIWDIVIP